MSGAAAYLWVALGGAAGALARYGVARVVAHVTRAPAEQSALVLPVATWIVNLGGSFLIGLAVPLLAREPGALRMLFVVGFLGAFTTFSTFSLETLALWQDGRLGWALVNSLGSVVAGLGCAALGLWRGRLWSGA